jgi:hypothetical protein
VPIQKITTITAICGNVPQPARAIPGTGSLSLQQILSTVHTVLLYGMIA